MSPHEILILSYNNLPALKKCVESAEKQDVGTYIHIIDNASTDGTREWLRKKYNPKYNQARINDKNEGVSRGWNIGLSDFFQYHNCEYVLVLNQDLILPPYFYRELLECNVPFVTGFPVQTEFEIGPLAAKPQIGLSPYPCFSAFLIGKSCWEKVGPFEAPSSRDAADGFFGWAGDCSYHVRAHRLGIPLYKSGVPFFHEAGSTMRNAPEEERQWFKERANKDRAYFRSLYGCVPGEEPAYSDLFK